MMYDESNPNITPSDERTIIAAHNLTSHSFEGNVSLQLKEEKYLQNIDHSKIKNVIIFDDVGGAILANSTLHPDIPDFCRMSCGLRMVSGSGKYPSLLSFWGRNMEIYVLSCMKRKD